MRWRIERDYQDLKQEIGLGHYEGRGWRGFHHHGTLCIAAYGFLVSERETIPPSGPGCSGRFAKPAIPAGYRPRGAAAPASTARPQLDRHRAPNVSVPSRRPKTVADLSITQSGRRTQSPLDTTATITGGLSAGSSDSDQLGIEETVGVIRMPGMRRILLLRLAESGSWDAAGGSAHARCRMSAFAVSSPKPRLLL